MLKRTLWFLSLAMAISASAIADNGGRDKPDDDDGDFVLASRPLGKGKIPPAYTCDGADISPKLTWFNPPAGTVSYTIIMDDPDAQSVAGFTWVHWNVFNIDNDLNSLKRGRSKKPDNGLQEGLNDFGNQGYDGPCPPAGQEHEYHFAIYALDVVLSNPSSPITRQEFENLYKGSILDKSEITVEYKRHGN